METNSNALAPPAYMVEVWPYAERSRGISVFQLFGRLAGFFTTFVNPIGLDSVGWKYLISYCCWLAYEVVFVYFFFPETFGRTLEELAFSEFFFPPVVMIDRSSSNGPSQCSRTSISPTRPSPLSRRLLERAPTTPASTRRIRPRSRSMFKASVMFVAGEPPSTKAQHRLHHRYFLAMVAYGSKHAWARVFC